MRHLDLLQRFPWHMTWMKDLGSEVARQPEGDVGRQAKSSQSSQPNPNPDHDRTVKPVVCPQRGAPHSQDIETRSFREEAVRYDRTEKPVVCRDENHERPTVVCSEQASHPRFSREGQNLIHDRTVRRRNKSRSERGNLLFAVMQITSAQCWTRLTSTSEYLDCHILLWNKLITIVFVNLWRRSRTTLTDNLFNEIYNKTMPTTHSVRSPRKWLRTWAM